jgi:hypothetical protein
VYTFLSNKHPLQPYIISPAQNVFQNKSFFLNWLFGLMTDFDLKKKETI